MDGRITSIEAFAVKQGDELLFGNGYALRVKRVDEVNTTETGVQVVVFDRLTGLLELLQFAKSNGLTVFMEGAYGR